MSSGHYHEEWWIDNYLHRIDGPAILSKRNLNDESSVQDYEQWWVNSKLHRIAGPAIKYTDGGEAWFLNGVRHREDGPAVDDNHGHLEY